MEYHLKDHQIGLTEQRSQAQKYLDVCLDACRHER